MEPTLVFLISIKQPDIIISKMHYSTKIRGLNLDQLSYLYLTTI